MILFIDVIYKSVFPQVYASINCGSGILEFLVLPVTLKYIQNKNLWLCMPSIVLVLSVLVSQTATATNLNLMIVTIAFIVMKVLEYSLRGVVTEMVRLLYKKRDLLGRGVVNCISSVSRSSR